MSEAIKTILLVDDDEAVVLDLNMPDMGGYACLQRLLEISPEAKVIVARGYKAEGEAQRMLDTGAMDLLGEPFRLNEMPAKVRAVSDTPAPVTEAIEGRRPDIDPERPLGRLGPVPAGT
ncbi:MAG: response regulator [Proteobacteria bacterium]|nr:response regulator [Pseudomonadota bacterium]